MSSMAFSTAYQEVAGQLGVDYTNTDTLTRLKRWVNMSYQDVVGAFEWSWLKDRESVTMASDYTTGTAAVAVGGTTVTFSAAIAVSRTGWYIQFTDSKNWYKITAHTAATDTATIDPAFCETTALTVSTFIIRKYYYSLSSSCEYAEDCRQAVTNLPVPIINARDYDRVGFPTDTATTVKQIVFWGMDSNNYWTFTPFPIPSAPLLLEFRTIKRVSSLSADVDTTLFPARFDSIWLDRAKMYGYEFLNDKDMYTLMYKKTEATLKDMKGKDRPGRSEPLILDTIDGQNKTNVVRFPADYDENLR